MRKLNIILGCEESQAVCIEMRNKGHNAYSCDVQACSGGHPEWHIQEDIFDVINGGKFYTEDGRLGCVHKWDMMIAFPPCTDLAVSGARYFERKRNDGSQRESIEFFMKLWNAPIEMKVLENPVGIISGEYIKEHFPELCERYGLPMKYSQIIEPYYFGDSANKKTCLWISGLSLLQHDPKNYAEGSKYITSPSGRRYPEWQWKTGKGCGTERSKTYPGIARAMADQWG